MKISTLSELGTVVVVIVGAAALNVSFVPLDEAGMDEVAFSILLLGNAYGGAKPVPPCVRFQALVSNARPGPEDRIPTSRLNRKSHSALSAAVWFQGSSL